MNCVRALTEGCVMNSILTTLCFGGVPWCPAGIGRAVEIRTRPGSVIDAAWPAGWPRGIREVMTERKIFNAHGTFYELPNPTSGGIDEGLNN